MECTVMAARLSQLESTHYGVYRDVYVLYYRLGWDGMGWERSHLDNQLRPTHMKYYPVCRRRGGPFRVVDEH